MARNAWFSCVLFVITMAAPSIASAQVIIQPGYTTTDPQQAYVVPSQTYGQPQAYGSGVQCPPDATLQPDRRGIARCMRLESGHRISVGLTVGGAVMLGVGWLMEILTTAFSSLDGHFAIRGTYMDWGWVPLVGPWVQMGDLPPNTSTPMYLWLGFEGLVQDAGLVMLIFGLIGEDYEEYRPVAAGDVRVRPMMSASVQGLTLEGAF